VQTTEAGTTGRHATALPALSVVVPVHNEADNIAPLLAEIQAALEGVLDYEVVYVDDGSTDATPRILKECLTKYPRLRPLRHVRNSGQSAAMATGVRASRAPWIVTLDGDGQNDPADIPALLAKLPGASASAAPAMICGQRTKRRDTWLKRVSSKVANGVRGWVLRDHTPDIGCGLKVFKRDVFLKLPHFDHMHRFLPALFQRAGEQVVSVPVSHRPRTKGRSHYGMHDRLWVGIVDILGVLWLGRRMKLTDALDLARGDAGVAPESNLRADPRATKPGGTGSA
jgi:dolichol-phosphate mannosyltransferase